MRISLDVVVSHRPIRVNSRVTLFVGDIQVGMPGSKAGFDLFLGNWFQILFFDKIELSFENIVHSFIHFVLLFK